MLISVIVIAKFYISLTHVGIDFVGIEVMSGNYLKIFTTFMLFSQRLIKT